MTIRAWRLVREARKEDAFTGEGARLYGGRWNPRGMRATYLSGTRSLAALEVLVHQADRVPTGRFLFFEVRFPESLVLPVSRDDLDADWRSYPPRQSTVSVGRDWLKAASSPVLRVPSIVVPEESNYLLNFEHPRSEEIEILGAEPFAFDPRLLKPAAGLTEPGFPCL